MIKPQQFVKWTSHDDQGRFSHSGVVSHVSDSDATIITQRDGTMTVPLDDGKIVPIAKPKSFDGAIITQPSQRTVTSHKPKKVVGGKLKQVVDLLSQHPSLLDDRKSAIRAIVDAGISSEKGASTWFSNAKKQLRN